MLDPVGRCTMREGGHTNFEDTPFVQVAELCETRRMRALGEQWRPPAACQSFVESPARYYRTETIVPANSSIRQDL